MNSFSIQLNCVNLSFESHCVFDTLSLNLAAEQIHCVLGRSGIGKSCLLNLISGAMKPDSGSITVGNTDELIGKVAHMFQDDGLLPWLTVLDNVQLGPRLRGERCSSYDDKAMHLLTRVGLDDWAKRYPVSLSGGMRQRVALARTLMEERPVILMDEPFSKLDAITRRELHVLSCELLQNRTVVMVTHDPSEALSLAHTITILHSGKPSVTDVFHLPSEPLRSHDDPDVLKLYSGFWSALSSDLQTRELAT